MGYKMQSNEECENGAYVRVSGILFLFGQMHGFHTAILHVQGYRKRRLTGIVFSAVSNRVANLAVLAHVRAAMI